MKCTTVRSKLAGYLDDVVESASRTTERGDMREHLEACAYCREEQRRYRQLAALVTLSDSPGNWAPENHDSELALPHGLMLDVTVDAQGQMIGYQILSGPHTREMQHQLDQMLLFSRFQPMRSFGRKISGGHVILSFSAVRVRG